jgi:pimeloyl-ACP methyl ester carboxylesterase
MEALFPSGLRRVVLEGAGHFLQLEAPDRVTAEILDFLRLESHSSRRLA